MLKLDIYKGRKVLITGHTGFKGSWLCKLLLMAGADVVGYALEPPTDPSAFGILGLDRQMHSVTGDIRDRDRLMKVVAEEQPEFIFHLAAQPIVRESYKRPADTYETNVMGTVNLLEAARGAASVVSLLNVTTDKVYLNREWEWGYRETDVLDGFDPYSNSKSCSELVTHSYRNSFFAEGQMAVSTARAGNVIGGGDFAADRIIPDSVRAALAGRPLEIRNPHSTRPYQHVMEPLCAYLEIAGRQLEDVGKPLADQQYAGCYNVGPDEADCVSTASLIGIFAETWGPDFQWRSCSDGGPHEANFLKLDCSHIRSVLGWQATWHIREAVEKTVDWTKAWRDGEDMNRITEEQIRDFLNKRMERETDKCLNI